MMPLYCSQGHNNDSSNRFCKVCGQRLPLGHGRVLDKRYRIDRQLGQGGFGRTYLAEALHRFNERCVLKEFAPQVQGSAELQKAKELFEREAGALHQLNHPQLPRFWELFQADLGNDAGALFLVQDFVDGSTYFDKFKSGKRLSEADAVQLMYQLLPVLSYIHAKGVIHRDISPDNIILRTSDQLPVLIDFGCVKQIAATAVSNFTSLGVVQTRLGKKGYAPEEQLRKGEVYVNSDLYSLAVTVLVLLTGKEPQHLYDVYKASWLWDKEIKVSPQLKVVLQKMLAHRPSDRFSSADEVLQALPSQQSSTSSASTPAPITQAITQPHPISRAFKPSAIVSYMHTLVVAPKKLPIVAATPSPITPQANPQPNPPAIPKPPLFLNKLGLWMLKLSVGIVFILFTGYAGWAVMNSMIRSVRLNVGLDSSSDTSSNQAPNSQEQRRIEQLLRRRQALNLSDAYFNRLVNDEFYRQHPEVRGRTLTLNPEDTPLREAWHNTAEDLLDKLEQAQLSATVRRQIGSYTQENYQTWQRQAKQGQLGGYTMDKLIQQTDKKFYQLFPEQRSQTLNLETYGQIWYALFSDQASQLETGKTP